MASNTNIVIIEGTLGADAESRFTNSNKEVTNFSVAVNESYKDNSDNWQNVVSWINVVKWSPSDYVKDHLKKGKSVLVTGKLKQETYTDKDDNKRSKTYVNALKIKPIQYPKSENSGSSDTYDGGNEPGDDNDDLPF